MHVVCSDRRCRYHLLSLDITCYRLISIDIIRYHSISLDITLVQIDEVASHQACSCSRSRLQYLGGSRSWYGSPHAISLRPSSSARRVFPAFAFATLFNFCVPSCLAQRQVVDVCDQYFDIHCRWHPVTQGNCSEFSLTSFHFVSLRFVSFYFCNGFAARLLCFSLRF